jgi:hypothetical protein
MTLYDVLGLLGVLLRFVGALVFGVASGWLVIHLLKWQIWQVAAAAVLGFFGVFALLGYWISGGGTIGAFGLGAGAGVLIWGLMPERSKDEEGKTVSKK